MKMKFTMKDSMLANTDWGANCGPHSLAAALAVDLATIRKLMPDFEGKGYTNPTMLRRVLDNVGMEYELTKGLKTREVCEGINRVQWEGPWLNPGVPPRVAYFQTHIVAAAADMVFCTCTSIGWVPVDEWRAHLDEIVPAWPKCTGWHITHHFKFEVLAKEVAK